MKTTTHPLQQAFETRVRLLETTLQPSTIRSYKRTVRLFLEYMNECHSDVRHPFQLRRDPHLLGWLEYLWKLPSTSGSSLSPEARGQHVMRLRTLLELLADAPRPPLAGLLHRGDAPPRTYRLPRPLSPEDDARLQQYWSAATDVFNNALLLQRLTGMRIGECVDLEPDAVRHLGDNQWSLHVPNGKPRSERWVPVDDRVRIVMERLKFLRTLPPGADPRYLLPRPKGRAELLSSLRDAMRKAAAALEIQKHIVPHQLRHTFATTMLRAGVSLPALMKLLGHHSANMTLLYVEVNQLDLQREYHMACLQPRYLVPVPPALRDDLHLDPPSASGLIVAINSALRLMGSYRESSPSLSANRQLLLLSRRLARIRTMLEKLDKDRDGEK